MKAMISTVSAGSIGDFFVSNIAAEYAVNRYATVFARLENAFGETYEIPNGYRAPGFGAFGGIRVANR